MNLLTKIKKASAVSVPVVAINSSDPAATASGIASTLGKPVVVWDVAGGFSVPVGANHQESTKVIKEIEGDGLYTAVEVLNSAKLRMPRASVLIIYNCQRMFDSGNPIEFIQAVWNIRDAFKANQRMLILMGISIRLPAELQHDVVTLDEPLPTHAEIRNVVSKLVSSAKLSVSDDQVEKAATACAGLSAFAAEQLASLNLSKAGICAQGVWQDKCHKIDETPGLRVVTGGSFADVAGVEAAKTFLSMICRGKKAPNCIVFVDEIEKALGGSSGDTSGVSQDQLGVKLQWMQDKKATGMIFLGAPGACKSALAKAAGGEFGIPTIQLDLGGMKGSLVGESETRIREALKVIDAVSDGNTLWIATSNNISNLPPELKRRYKYGVWFFDLPTRAEREQIWNLYTTKFGLVSAGESVLDREFTGAEIESCCEIADRTGLSLEEAAEYIVPVSKAGAAQLDRLRDSADGKYLSASVRGEYRKNAADMGIGNSAEVGRAFDLA